MQITASRMNSHYYLKMQSVINKPVKQLMFMNLYDAADPKAARVVSVLRRLLSLMPKMYVGTVRGLGQLHRPRGTALLERILAMTLQNSALQFLHWPYELDKLTTQQLRRVLRSLGGSIRSLRGRVRLRSMGRKALVMLVVYVLAPALCTVSVATWRGLALTARRAKSSMLTAALKASLWRISREIGRAATSRTLHRLVFRAVANAVAVAIPIVLLGARILRTQAVRRLVYVSIQRLVQITWLVQYKSIAYLTSTTFSTLTPKLLSLMSMIIPLMSSAVQRLTTPSSRHMVYVWLRDYLLPAILSVSRLSIKTVTDPKTRQLVSQVVRAALSLLGSMVTSISLAIFSVPATRQYIMESAGILVNPQLQERVSNDTPAMSSSCSRHHPRQLNTPTVRVLDAEEEETVDIIEVSPSSDNAEESSTTTLPSVIGIGIPEWIPAELFRFIPFVGEFSLCPRLFLDMIYAVVKIVTMKWKDIYYSGFLTQVASLTLDNTRQLLPLVFVEKQQTLVVQFIKGLVISALDALAYPELLGSLAASLEIIMSTKTPRAMSSALRDLLPPSIRVLIASGVRGVQSITDGKTLSFPDARLSPALEKLFYGLVAILMWPSVQKMIVPLIQVVIAPAMKVALSPRAQWFLSPVKQVLSSPRTQMVIRPARKCMSYCSERVQQKGSELRRVLVPASQFIQDSPRTQILVGPAKKCIYFCAEKMQTRERLSAC